MNQKKLFSIVACAVFAMIFLFGFSGDDNRLSTTTSSWQSSSSEIVVTNGNQPDGIGAWTTGMNFPVPLTDLSHGQGFERNDTAWVFILGGEANLTDVRRYNVNTDTWSTVAPLPSGRDRGASARLVDSLYMVGGANTSTTYSNTLFRYDVNGNSWTSRANIPQNVGWGKAAGYQDSLIYLVGGYNGSATLNTVYVYNCISDTWRTCTSLPAVRFGGAMAIVGDTIVYAGGVDGAAVVNVTYRGVINQSDRSVITWNTGAPMPAPVSTGMFRIDGHTWADRGMILTGGSTAVPFSSVSNICLVYSPGADSWTQQANKPTAWTAGQSGVVKYSSGIWKLVCASGYSGVTQLTQTEILTDTILVTSVTNNGSGIPQQFKLSQNYPNPFNPSTKISFSIPRSGFVTLKVYDMLGSEVQTIVSEQLNAGEYISEFDGAKLSSGTYFYRIQVGDFVETKKMILIK
ncbi:MAG: T9SS type A sorting domain-containing protein [Ignavibacteriae bacterium]|nr:T9SS type A sorting domain-containing protein [Ignavibacteriota bacterium]MCB9244297.1 T9SS type A sorting domain-containing protein [Ignavibacteriales bacterium]